MIDKGQVIAFFDSWAPRWDADMVCDDAVIGTILDNSGVHEGVKVLDVACGTGVLVPYYRARKTASVTGVDISPEMIRISRSKFSFPDTEFICGDAETGFFGDGFGSIVIYNAFPHFADPRQLICNLCSMLASGGILTVAHGMSREKVNSHHGGSAAAISEGLMPAEELADLFARHLEVTCVVSDGRMYQVCGRAR